MNDNNILIDNDLLELQGIDYVRENEWNVYDNSGNGVPRVSHILAQCRNSEGLIQWAANIGRRKYDYYREKALTTGTIVHEMIDTFLLSKYKNHTNFDLSFYDNDFPEDCKTQIHNSVNNFIFWDNKLNELGYHIEEIIGIEVTITCPYYGGTIDAIIRINGAVYILDFKTSKQISPEYLLQASAYMWMVNNGYGGDLPHIDGIGIIRVDKNKYGIINDLFLNDFDQNQHFMINSYQKCFASYVEAYYRTYSTNYITKEYINIYDPVKVFSNIGKE